MPKNPKSAYAETALRIQAAEDMMIAGILQNNPEVVESALAGFVEIKHSAIQNKRRKFVDQVDECLSRKIVGHTLIDRVIKGKMHEEILQMILEQTQLLPAHLKDVNFSRMTKSTSEMLVDNLIKGHSEGSSDYQSMLTAFEDKKHHEAWKRLYAHLLWTTLSVSKPKYRDEHMATDQNIFTVVNKKMGGPLIEMITDVLMENQQAVLEHFKKQKVFATSPPPMDARMVIKLHGLGFTGLSEIWGPKLFFTVADPRQLLHAEAAGIPIRKEFVINKLMFKAYGDRNEHYAEYLSRMDTDAIVYALESDTFTLDDLKELKSTLKSSRSRVDMHLEDRMAHDLVYALRGVYKDKGTEISPLLAKKTAFMVSWGMKTRHDSYRRELISTLIELHQMPSQIIHSHPLLRDAKFGSDLGL